MRIKKEEPKTGKLKQPAAMNMLVPFLRAYPKIQIWRLSIRSTRVRGQALRNGAKPSRAAPHRRPRPQSNQDCAHISLVLVWLTWSRSASTYLLLFLLPTRPLPFCTATPRIQHVSSPKSSTSALDPIHSYSSSIELHRLSNQTSSTRPSRRRRRHRHRHRHRHTTHTDGYPPTTGASLDAHTSLSYLSHPESWQLAVLHRP